MQNLVAEFFQLNRSNDTSGGLPSFQVEHLRYHNYSWNYSALRFMKACIKVSKALKRIKSTINCQLIEEIQNDQYKKYSFFDDLRDGSKQMSIAFMFAI